jgi:hypothetical protein
MARGALPRVGKGMSLKINVKKAASQKRAPQQQLLERLMAEGKVKVRYICPRCGGGHHVRDCPQQVDRAA